MITKPSITVINTMPIRNVEISTKRRTGEIENFGTVAYTLDTGDIFSLSNLPNCDKEIEDGVYIVNNVDKSKGKFTVTCLDSKDCTKTEIDKDKYYHICAEVRRLGSLDIQA